jgi:hypothetical protein
MVLMVEGLPESSSSPDLFEPRDDGGEPLLAMARYLVKCAFRESLHGRSREEIAVIVMGLSRCIAIELLEEHGMSRERARIFINQHSRLLEHMTDKMAREAGFA